MKKFFAMFLVFSLVVSALFSTGSAFASEPESYNNRDIVVDGTEVLPMADDLVTEKTATKEVSVTEDEIDLSQEEWDRESTGRREVAGANESELDFDIRTGVIDNRVISLPSAYRQVDRELVQTDQYGRLINITPGAVNPAANEYEVYSHTYYKNGTKSLTGTNVGPEEKTERLASVARGGKKTVKHNFSIGGNVKFGFAGDGALQNIVKKLLVDDISGHVEYSYTKDTTYEGPPANSKYKSFVYYTSINYDQYSVTAKKYQVYKRYSGKGSFLGYVT